MLREQVCWLLGATRTAADSATMMLILHTARE
jgi:hypothetical protein